eukprot:4659516-Amphidinium_carterae.1
MFRKPSMNTDLLHPRADKSSQKSSFRKSSASLTYRPYSYSFEFVGISFASSIFNRQKAMGAVTQSMGAVTQLADTAASSAGSAARCAKRTPA